MNKLIKAACTDRLAPFLVINEGRAKVSSCGVCRWMIDMTRKRLNKNLMKTFCVAAAARPSLENASHRHERRRKKFRPSLDGIGNVWASAQEPTPARSLLHLSFTAPTVWLLADKYNSPSLLPTTLHLPVSTLANTSWFYCPTSRLILIEFPSRQQQPEPVVGFLLYQVIDLTVGAAD